MYIIYDDDDVSFSLQSTLSKRFRGSTPSFYQETPNFMLPYQNYTGQVHQSSGTNITHHSSHTSQHTSILPPLSTTTTITEFSTTDPQLVFPVPPCTYPLKRISRVYQLIEQGPEKKPSILIAAASRISSLATDVTTPHWTLFDRPSGVLSNATTAAGYFQCPHSAISALDPGPLMGPPSCN